MSDFWAWLLFFFMLVSIVVMVIYQLMCLADLEFDYINPFDSASRINKVILPEFITHGILCFLYLVTGHWFAALLCVPYSYYNVTLYLGRQHLIDVTEIFNKLNCEKKRRLWKLAYLVIMLFISLFISKIRTKDSFQTKTHLYWQNGRAQLTAGFMGVGANSPGCLIIWKERLYSRYSNILFRV
ncbi:unnamed protein product [Cuscuta epithymum]|uniref:Cornichon family protein n=1 Tax=Cuscuta epithymum TaxID=186058 RepID=A0AAV0FP42_9ASTE|nr:unnamed protein product [Cuscuta epithymum]